MNDEEIVTALRGRAGKASPVELVDLLAKLSSEAVSQASIVTYFKRAFPEIPLRILLEAGAWTRVSHGGLSDEEFNELLSPWTRS